MALYNGVVNGWWNKDKPNEGDTWGGGAWERAMGGGDGGSYAAGSIFHNGKWMDPLTYQENQLTSKKLGYESQNAELQNQILQGQLQAQNGYNTVATTAGNKLNALLTNPSSVADTPAYQFAYNQGLEGVNRTAAAKGQLGSGNRLYDLTKYGQGLASQTYNNTVNQLGSFLNKTPVTHATNTYTTTGNATNYGGSY